MLQTAASVEFSTYDTFLMPGDLGLPVNPAIANSGHMTTQSMSPQCRGPPILSFTTKKLSTGPHGQKEDFERAVTIAQWCDVRHGRPVFEPRAAVYVIQNHFQADFKSSDLLVI